MATVIDTPLPYQIVAEQTDGGREERGIELRFHPGQERAYNSTARVVAMISGTQSGKTTFGPWWLYREITNNGGGDYLAVTATYDLFKLKMLPALLDVYVHTLGIGYYWGGDQVIELYEHTRTPEGVWKLKPGGSRARQSSGHMWGRIILRSAASEGGLESTTAKAAWLDEAGLETFGLDAWDAILRRLSLYRGRILITTTPYNNTGWLKREVYDRWSAGDDTRDVVQFASVENPAFPKDEFEERQRTMAVWKFNMFYKGQFQRPAGLVYPDYRDEDIGQGGHVMAPFAIPEGWPRFLGVDPGPVYYTLLYATVEPVTDTLIIFREFQYSYQSTQEIVRDVLARIFADDQPPFNAYYVGGKPDVQARLDWMNSGAHPVCEPPFSDVDSGIDRVTHLLRTNRLRIFSTCMGTRDEFNTYRRKLDEQGLPTEAIEDPHAYHFMDALRYLASGVSYKRTAILAPAPAILEQYRGDIL